MDRTLRILVQASSIRLPAPARDANERVQRDVLVTLANNLTAFGWALSRDAFDALARTSEGGARAWWEEIEPVLMDLTGADRKMDDHVVYKNFPHEVLAMSEAEYWGRQILMYWGLPNEWFTEEPLPRAPLDEKLSLRVLHPAGPDALRKVFRALLDQPTRWTADQKENARFLLEKCFRERCDLSTIAFKENMAALAVLCGELGVPAKVDTATDVLRVAAGMSDGDVSLREPCKIRNLRRAERRFLLGLLEAATHLEDDFARRPERFKRLVHQVHAGDWPQRYPRVVAAAKALYEDELPPTSNAVAEAKLSAHDARLLDEMKARPGEMMRRLHHLVLVYGDAAARAFVEVLPRLTVFQLVRIERYLAKVNERRVRTFPPKGSWSKLQIVPADPRRRIPSSVLAVLLPALAAELRKRVGKRVPSVALAPETKLVKLPTSDSELLPYGRGTVFFVPERVTFVRTAVYWASGQTTHNVWYDNGWNFFDESWKPRGACCWSAVKFAKGAAIFGGDPTNSKDLEGRACQLIDLHLDRLGAEGVRWAVWNVLCYSHVTFDQAKEVFAALQWGERPAEGNLFEPARCQLAFPIKGPQMTKYVAMLDVARRQLVYLDANLGARVSSAVANGEILARTMPAFVEYLDSLPTVHDVFVHLPASPDGTPVLYDDAKSPVVDREAYVFRPVNQASRLRKLPLEEILVTA